MVQCSVFVHTLHFGEPEGGDRPKPPETAAGTVIFNSMHIAENEKLELIDEIGKARSFVIIFDGCDYEEGTVWTKAMSSGSRETGIAFIHLSSRAAELCHTTSGIGIQLFHFRL